MVRFSGRKDKVIAIDASRAFVHERTGIEEYAYQVVKHLRISLAQHPIVLYVRFRGEAARHPRTWIAQHFFVLPDAWEVRVVSWRRLWTQCGLALALWRDRPAVLFVPAHTVPWIHPRKTIVVVHGLEYEMTPRAYSMWARFYMRMTIKASCRWASQIITVSENTKRDVMQLYGIDKQKMTVIYEGVNVPDANYDDKKCCEKLPYFLFIGRLEERKNIVRLILAFTHFKRMTRSSHQLILAGGRGYGFAHVAATVATSPYRDDIIMPGFVTERKKWRLLRHATAFLFPTLYEGFGLPVLEAQSVGVPVITSALSSLPEVVGTGRDASALVVDPLNVNAIAAAMEQVLNPVVRHDIIAKGYRNTERFTWAQCADAIAHTLIRM